jgi:aspartate oxidase
VYAPRAIDAIAAGRDGFEPTGVLRVDPRGTPTAEWTHSPAVDGHRTQGITLDELQRVMTTGAGVLRDRASLEAVLEQLPAAPAARDVQGYELRNLLAVARALATAALARAESRGTHTRLDFPDRSTDWLGRFFHLGTGMSFHPLPADVRERSA